MLKGPTKKKKMIKTMNSKMTTDSQLLTSELKTKTDYANNYNRNRITEIEITRRIISGEGGGRMEGKGTGNKKHKW